MIDPKIFNLHPSTKLFKRDDGTLCLLISRKSWVISAHLKTLNLLRKQNDRYKFV